MTDGSFTKVAVLIIEKCSVVFVEIEVLLDRYT